MTVEETVNLIAAAGTWDERVNNIRQVPARHGTNEQPSIYAQIAKQLYVPHLAPDFAYIHVLDFYELPHFQQAYDKAAAATANFTKVSVTEVASALKQEPRILLALRTITGLTKSEFAASTELVGVSLGLKAISQAKVDSMERTGTKTTEKQARVVAETLDRIMSGSLFGTPPQAAVKSKQNKPDTIQGWTSARAFAANGVPYAKFLHQRHYGGAYRQVLDAAGKLRGDMVEDAVEALFVGKQIPYIRTGAHNQGDIAARFNVEVKPAPDFVVFDDTDTLRAMLECKGANDGGTARDKASRFRGLRAESIRLGGLPLIGVLVGLGWTRVNDTLGPVVRDCDGRVFSVSNLPDMLTLNPFPSLIGVAQ